MNENQFKKISEYYKQIDDFKSTLEYIERIKEYETDLLLKEIASDIFEKKSEHSMLFHISPLQEVFFAKQKEIRAVILNIIETEENKILQEKNKIENLILNINVDFKENRK